MSRKKQILWVEDDLFHIDEYIQALEDEGYEVLTATNLSAGRQMLTDHAVDAVITDLRLPPGDDPDWRRTREGYNSGIVFGSWVKQNYPQLPIIGMSGVGDQWAMNWFKTHAAGYVEKPVRIPTELRPFVEYVNGIVGGLKPTQQPRVFIVHGWDDETKNALKNYVQNTLRLGEPVILHERPFLGRTIIEKFEDEASDADLVFVILTPDDTAHDSTNADISKKRARQNVIFEMGYLLAKLQRRSGRMLLLYKGDLELPSDIAGLGYIDINRGIEAAGEEIRKELREFL